MLNKKNLTYWTLPTFSYILTPIDNFVFFTLNKGHENTVLTKTDRAFCFVKKGAVKAKFENYHNEAQNEEIILSSGMLIHWIGSGSVKFFAIEENVEVLIVSFKLLRPKSTNEKSENDILFSEEPILMQKLSIEMPRLLLFENTSSEYMLLEKMCSEIKQRNNGFFNKLQILLSELVIEIVMTRPRVPRFINAVAIMSITDNDQPLQKGREVYIKDVEIWCNNPENNDAVILRTMRTDRYFISDIKQETANYEVVSDKDDQAIGKLFSGDNDAYYKVVLWSDIGVDPIDIEFYAKKWIYIRTKIKSNIEGNIGLALYSTKDHYFSGRPIMINKVDEWQEIVAPMMFVQSVRDASPIVSRALKFIHSNYSRKITLKSVAEEIFVNPNYLSTLFSKEKGVTFSLYLRRYRIRMAQKLLVETDQSIEKIALEVGFYDVQHFSKIFKKETGVSPGDFRRKNRI